MTAVVGGLIRRTTLSLFHLPIMHTYLDNMARWLNCVFLKREYRWPVIVL